MLKKASLLFVFVLTFLLTSIYVNTDIYAAEGDAQWVRSAVTAPNQSFFNGSSVDSYGNVYSAGYLAGNGQFNFGNGITVTGAYNGNNAFITKHDSEGNVKWAKSVTTGPNQSSFFGIFTDSSGNSYAVGSINGNGQFDFGNSVTVTGNYASNTNAVLVKYDSDGNTQWAKSVTTGPNRSRFHSAKIDNAGNVYVSGLIYGNSQYDFGNSVTVTGNYASNTNAVLVKYDSDGDAQWAKSVTTGPNASEYYGLVLDVEGNIYLSGYIYGNAQFGFGNGVTVTGGFTNNYNALLIKYDSSGTPVWAKTATTAPNQSYLAGLAIDGSGNLYVSGYIYGTGQFSFGSATVTGTNSTLNMLLIKYALDGTPIWARSVTQGSNISILGSVGVDIAGNVYMTGYIYGTGQFGFGNGIYVSGSNSTYNSALVKFDSNGNAQWAKSTVAGSNVSLISGIAVARDGSVYISGYANGTGTYNFGNGVTINAANAGSNIVLIKYLGHIFPSVYDPCDNSCLNTKDYTYNAPTPVGFIEKNGVLSIVNAGTFKYDANLFVDDTPKLGSIRLVDMSYWQVGPMKEVWWKSIDNGAKIMPSEVQKPFTLIFKYDPSSLEKSISENSLKLAYSVDGKNWKIIKSALDTQKNELVIVTKNGGYYSIVGGGVQFASTTKLQEPNLLKKDEAVATPVPQVQSNVEETTQSKKRCFLFFCW